MFATAVTIIMVNILFISCCKAYRVHQSRIKSICNIRDISILKMSDSDANTIPKFVRGSFFTKRLIANKNTASSTENHIGDSISSNNRKVSIKKSIEEEPTLSLSLTSPKTPTAQKRIQQVKELQAQLPTMEQFRAMKKATGVLPPNTRKTVSTRGYKESHQSSSSSFSTPPSTTAMNSNIDPKAVSSTTTSKDKPTSSPSKIKEGSNKVGSYSIFTTFKKNPVKLLRALEGLSEEGSFTPEMALIAIRTFQKLNTDQIDGNVIDTVVTMWVKAVEKIKLNSINMKTTTIATAHVDNTYINSISDNNDAMKPIIDLKMVVTLVRELCRSQRMSAAYTVCQSCGITLLDSSTVSVSVTISTTATTTTTTTTTTNTHSTTLSSTIETPAAQYTIYEEKLLPELAFGYTISNNFSQAIQCLESMSKQNIELNLATSKKILTHFLISSDLYYIRRCLRVLIKLDGISDQDSVQILANYFMQHCEFVKGAVSMETLPPAQYSEVAFIGRSNVGKSSLLNMVSNRKGLAYVSKTPGKTSEFNYFYANGTLGHRSENHHFYLVDLPGVGYAEARKDKRESWLRLLKSYVGERKTLRLLFHLIDSRHGFLASDDDCLDLLKTLPDHVQYVVVLTKCDKRGGGMKVDMVDSMQAILQQKLREKYISDIDGELTQSTTTAMSYATEGSSSSSSSSSSDDKYNTIQSDKKQTAATTSTTATIATRRIPIIQTSSEYKEGGAELWSLIIDAVAGENVGELFYGDVSK